MSANREALRMLKDREPVELGEGVTPERVVALALNVVDLGYRAHGENGRASLPAVQVDWMMQQWAEAEERGARLLIAFHDAIRWPLGVTPDSGAEFFDQRMADEAEARRLIRPVLRDLSPDEAAARAAALKQARRDEGDW